MKVKELIKTLRKVKDKEALVGFGVWFGERNFGTGHTIFWDGLSPRDIEVVNAGKGLKVAVVGYADNCPMYTFSNNQSKLVQSISV